jgi:ADP-heptose:LPS heptosyltransferase
VREHESLEFVQRYMPSIHPHLIPDALFTWYDYVNDSHCVENGRYYMGHSTEKDSYYDDLDFSKPYICISGSSAKFISQNPEHAIEIFSNLTRAAKEKFDENIFLIDVDEGDAFLEEVGRRTQTPVIALDTPILAAAKILGNARLFISGRYHPGIMASLGGTPCIFMSSNSHKTRSLQELLGYDSISEYPIDFNDQQIALILSEGQRRIDQGNMLREKIKLRCRSLRDEASVLEDFDSL